jgi:hypothetical protein
VRGERGIVVGFQARLRAFYLFFSVQSSSGAHPASYPFDAEGLSPEVKRFGLEDDYSPTADLEFNNTSTANTS